MAKRGENITKRKDGRWEARYIKSHENGRAVYGYVYGKTYSEAKRKKTDSMYQLSSKPPITSSYLFNEVIDAFLVQKQYTVKATTFSHYNNLINTHIKPFFGYRKTGDISVQLIELFASEKLKNGNLKSTKGLSHKTVKDILSLLKSIIKYGAKNRFIPDNLTEFSSPRVLKKEIEILSSVEREQLERYTIDSDNIYFGVYLCLYTGLRIGELCALQWGDIDLDNSCINVCKTITRVTLINSPTNHAKTAIIIDTPKSEASVRSIPIPNNLTSLLKMRVPIDVNDGFFFLTNTEKYIEPRNYYSKYKEILNECGIKQYTFHALRHTFATRCVEIGFDAKVLSEILGHADVKITLDRYVHPSIARKRSCMELLYQ